MKEQNKFLRLDMNTPKEMCPNKFANLRRKKLFLNDVMSNSSGISPISEIEEKVEIPANPQCDISILMEKDSESISSASKLDKIDES